MTTRRTMLKTGAVTAFVAVGGATLTADPAAAAPTSGPDRAALQDTLARMGANGASGILAEVRDRDWAWRGAAGVAELGTGRPVQPRGRFRVGSVTKSFVATVALQLVAERRLRLDDPVERYLPGLVPDGGRITVRHLMQHTSGLFDYTDGLLGGATVQDLVRMRYRSWSPRELLAYALDEAPLFEPGAGWSYSNTNYILVGLLIERVTGRPYGSEVTRRIIRPLGLHQTEVPGHDPDIAGPHAHGYLPLERDGGVVPVDITRFEPSIAWAAGEMLSSAEDLNRFYGALVGGRLLPASLLAQMQATTGPESYGLGLFSLTLPSGTTLWGHTGGIFGYETFAMGTADGRRQLSLSANPWGPHEPDDAMDQLLTLAFDGTGAAARTGRIQQLPKLGRF
ncbi:beta-lactamase family protein [Dactylosporangium sp. NBC_01737]|uniref:serine hydrolase domain-containing protein n=1 Tax=Dactylosporangium sp. NBC_01737 TaxID=2975959 RepID=UPI002E120A6A|nr:beta-lactamase family protein [Dactylosporangium sp. NBC_01737]